MTQFDMHAMLSLVVSYGVVRKPIRFWRSGRSRISLHEVLVPSWSMLITLSVSCQLSSLVMCWTRR